MFYVYEWYIVDTGEIIYVGKGFRNRYKCRKHNRIFAEFLKRYNCESRIVKYFEKEEDGYYFFSSHTLFSSDEYVVSTDDAKLAWISKLAGEVSVCTSNNRSYGYKQVEIGGSKYTLWDNVEKIIPDFTFMLMYFCIIAAAAAVIFDGSMLTVYIVRKYKGGHSPNENEEKTQS